MKVETSCPLCKSEKIITFLERSEVPVHQNLVMLTQQSARSIKKGRLLMGQCQNCQFIFNQAFDVSKLKYSSHYNNNQTYSEVFQNHMDTLISYLKERKEIKDSMVIEVGCGKGDFLRQFIVNSSGNKGYGFDPSYEGPKSIDNKVFFINDYFTEQYHSLNGDVCLCRHVIEHIEHPVEFLKNIRKGLGNTNAKLFFETPCVNWIIEHGALWDLFYEHCSYFSPETIKKAFALAGFQVDHVQHVFGGQYLWVEASISGAEQDLVQESEVLVSKGIEDFKQLDHTIKYKWENKLKALYQSGKVAIWGAGAKGVTFANLFDPQEKWIDCVIDINPRKNGGFLPGTGHEIVDLYKLKQRKVQHIIIMNPNYTDESRNLLDQHDIKASLLEMGD